VPGRVGDHGVADLARAALANGARARGRARLGDPGKQGVAGRGELRRARDPRLGGVQQRGRRRRLVACVARELGLEPPDLAAQLASRGPLVGLQPGIVEVELGRELVQIRLGGRGLVRKRVIEGGGQVGGDEGRDRDVAGVDAGRARGLDHLGGDSLDLGGTLGVVGDEAAATVPGDQEPVPLEPRVDGPDRVHVHLRPLRHRPHARHPLARGEPPGGDQRPQPPGELDAHGQLGAGVGGEGSRCRQLCHLDGTLAKLAVIVK
jgi:hypothetical protein